MRHLRESVFFVAHPIDGLGDALILTVVNYPGRGWSEAYRMGRVDGMPVFTRFTGTAAASVEVEVIEPFTTMRLTVPDELDLTWSARTRPHTLPHGKLTVDDEVVWDQEHLFQSGWFDGSYVVDGDVRQVRRWWGQRDESRGVRRHHKCPMWMWLAIQLPDGMLGAWCWEQPNGTRVYAEGCWAPSGSGDPIPVRGFQHDLHWTGSDGRQVGYGRAGLDVHGLAGEVRFELADGTKIAVTGAGTWAARYGPLGGGQHLMTVQTDDGRTGSAIYEITGTHHHRYFPISRTG